MFRKFSLLLLCNIIGAVSFTYAQTDNDEIDHARNAMAIHNCDDAIRFLDKVSQAGKTRPAYFLTMANAQDCKASNEQAIYYYSKYLEYVPTSDSVKKRVAELKDSKTQAQRSANEERVAKEQYQVATGKSKKKKHHNALDDTYMNLGVGFEKGVGGKLAPYKSGYNLCYGFAGPIAADKVLLDFQLNLDLMTNPNKAWFQSTYQLPSITGVDISPGLGGDLTLGIFPVLFNSKMVGVAAGPAAGAKMLYISDISDNYGYYSLSSSVFSMNYGIRANIYLGQKCMFYTEYALNSRKTVKAESYGPTGMRTAKVDLDLFRIGVAYRFDGWYY